ncbi:hypothetical protein ACLB2K_070990 [Fragaria x ananassa]
MLSPPIKVLHTAPEVEAEPEPKKLCVPPPDPGFKVDEAKASSGSYYCGFCDKNCDHNTAHCPFYDSDAEDDIYGEYKGPKEGFNYSLVDAVSSLVVTEPRDIAVFVRRTSFSSESDLKKHGDGRPSSIALSTVARGNKSSLAASHEAKIRSPISDLRFHADLFLHPHRSSRQ